MQTKARFYGIIAVALFGASAPFSKLLLNNVTPLQLAGLLYLGSGLCLLLVKLIKWSFNINRNAAKLEKADMPWLFGAVVSGGVLAPITLMVGLSMTPASTTSILLNFETVSTAVIAGIFFREHVGKKVIIAISLLTIASLILTFDHSGKFEISWGAFLILLACVLWGIDNNLTRNISSKDPMTIVIVKGVSAGLFSILLSMVLKNNLPNALTVLSGLALGGLSYGISLTLFISTLKDIGSSRASALFTTAPFIGAVISFIIFKNIPTLSFLVSVPLMICGTFLLFKESHEHMHKHPPINHEHAHRHDDEHHGHTHENGIQENIFHSHRHNHNSIVHFHNHMPDIHHRHDHI
jgi:drug/metabolite transporter (DMT)-like permease